MNEMKISEKAAKIWLAIFPGTMLLFFLGFVLFMHKPVSTESENRLPVSWGEVLEAPIDEKTEVFENWFNDRFPLRKNLIEGLSFVEYFVFDDSASSQIIRGKKGWCFFRGDEDYCVDQYKGLENYSDETIDEILENIKKNKDYLAERDVEFVIMVVPGKQRIYSEYMPSGIKIVDNECNTDEVIRAIREKTDVKLIWLQEDFEKYKEENPDGAPLYFKLESHWNKFGAYVGTTSLMRELSVPGYESEDFSKEALAARGITLFSDKQTNLDLTKLMNLSSILTDRAYFVDGYSENDPDIEKGEEEGSEIITSSCEAAPDNRKVYVYGDSFSRYMVPYLGCEFKEVYRDDEIDLELFEKEKPDVVVLQIVERNLGRLDDFDITTKKVVEED